ncbi:hypothetical protein NK8_84980 (plasmid) [Caballeronia sp. NK8]|uniref:hypothetical protein n=1 Tax=Caballeronia sp. NK8 TaxID=140098 RepID=UPI001BB67EC5|nr:hypothetical protein [Caballeronia sp. NK8]BCQ30307.1 hypothetical protein NK8_84980 [Caballeronia sp. NK8]
MHLRAPVSGYAEILIPEEEFITTEHDNTPIFQFPTDDMDLDCQLAQNAIKICAEAIRLKEKLNGTEPVGYGTYFREMQDVLNKKTVISDLYGRIHQIRQEEFDYDHGAPAGPEPLWLSKNISERAGYSYQESELDLKFFQMRFAQLESLTPLLKEYVDAVALEAGRQKGRLTVSLAQKGTYELVQRKSGFVVRGEILATDMARRATQAKRVVSR